MSTTKTNGRSRAAWSVLAAGLAMSLGWGIRGNYGHEFGAMIPGALVAMTICLASGRKDWIARLPLFALFGAVGWSFGGSMSYGILIGYTVAGNLPTVFYGFASLFLVGAIWGGIGAAVLSMAATWDRERLTRLLPPFIALLVVRTVVEFVLIGVYGESEPAQLDWYDSDWIAAATAVITLVGYALYQKRMSEPVSLMLHAALGWWAGMLILVQIAGLHLSPPRSDNWAGSLGMFLAILVFLIRRRDKPVLFASLFVALFGGLGFSTGELFQVLGRSLGPPMDWWKVMEQSFGLIMGVGVALAFLFMSRRSSVLEDDRKIRPWAEAFAVFFVLILVTYLNFSKNIEHLLSRQIIQERLLALPPQFWFNLAYLLLAGVTLAAILRHRRMPLPMIPASATGQGQLLLLAFLAIAIIGDLSGAAPYGSGNVRVQGSFFLFAIGVALWTLLAIQNSNTAPAIETGHEFSRDIRKTLIATGLAFVLAITAQALVARSAHDLPLYGAHNRFSPDPTEFESR